MLINITIIKTRITGIGPISTAVQKGRISSTGTDALISAPRGTAQVASMQAFYSNYIALLLRADTIAWLQQSGGVTPNGTGVNNSQELAMSLLITAVEWTRNIPFFQEFMLSDQSGLLRSCWSELFVLNVAQQCTSVTYLTSPYSALSSGTDSEYNENLRVFEEQVAKLKSLQLDATELCCLKAIILFNPGKDNLKWSAFDGYDFCMDAILHYFEYFESARQYIITFLRCVHFDQKRSKWEKTYRKASALKLIWGWHSDH